jgi:signal transduction histidine kinase
MEALSFDMERSIAHCRLVLAVTGILAWYVDPSAPVLTRWLAISGGSFVLDAYWVTVLLAYLAYAIAIASIQARQVVEPGRLARVTTVADVLFGAAIALVTEGTTSLFFVFFAFIVLTVGLRAGLRAALIVTAASIGVYTVVVVSSAPEEDQHLYVMRAAYLAMVGYLVGYLGEERTRQEERIVALESDAIRQTIARSLHDGYAQALAGVNLRLESCQELFRRGRTDEALAGLRELQAGVNREHDELRTYIRSLSARENTPGDDARAGRTRVVVRADFDADGAVVEHLLHIMLESTRNVLRHARARTAMISARTVAGGVIVAIEDDGVGLPAGVDPPWSIASRAAECGGEVTLGPQFEGGARLWVKVPSA